MIAETWFICLNYPVEAIVKLVGCLWLLNEAVEDLRDG